MREIKFRGKRADNGEWIYGDLLRRFGMYEIYRASGTMRVIPETVGQFTGLKDKNEVEVYEGDILSDMEDFPMTLPVLYDNENSMFCCDISYLKDGSNMDEIKECYPDGFVVVGNIYDDSSL